jgi:putative Mn2+ efflux pump MntP
MAFGASSLLLLSSGLAMDAAAVSAARGLATPVLRPRHALTVALYFGGFQAFMPLLGWLLGSQLGPLVAAWDHWIAFVLLAGLGVKMLWEARAPNDDEPVPEARDPFAPRVMFVLAIATSLDAFAVGVMLPMLGAPLVLSLLCIGSVTALLSVAGLYLGRHFGKLLGKRLDAVGGVVLLGMGTKILLEHLYWP